MSFQDSHARGPLALIGGRFESDNEILFQRLKTLCHGRIAVLAMASSYPLEVGQELVEDFRSYGFEAELVPLFWENRESAAYDEGVIDALASHGSIFFSGGDQSRIVETLIQAGKETPALECIRDCHARGGLIAGTSAGAAIMSGPMILSGTSLNALSAGLSDSAQDPDGFRLGSGLGFFSWGLVDQHFLHRGRIGRLLAASRELGQEMAFGVDENSALIVCGTTAEVVGETGVLFLDMRRASYAATGYDISNVRVSYLDDGDSFDLDRGKPKPAADKKRVRVTRASYRRPAPVRRHAFASYAVHDLILRLVEGDPAYYRQDSALAYDDVLEKQICLELERKPHRSRALRAIRDGEIRYSAIDFNLRVRSSHLPRAQYAAASTTVLPPDPVPEARLIMLGSSPLHWSQPNVAQLREELREPVGILGMASGEPRRKAGEYLHWLRGIGVQAEILDISLSNIERAGRDRRLLKRIGSMGSLLFTGGDQRRLTDTLLHCAEATPVLHALVSAYERGTPLIAVAAAASAFATRMIAEGDSEAALRHGVSEDAGFSGVVVEQGIGLTSFGLVDQNFMQRHRLGRLLVACKDQRSRFGFGLCEGSGLVMVGGRRQMHAIGRAGVIVAELDLDSFSMQPTRLQTEGVALHFVEAGTSFHLDTVAADASEHSSVGVAMLEQAIADLARDYNAGLAPGIARIDDGTLREALIPSPAVH